MEKRFFDKWTDIMEQEANLVSEAKRYIIEHWEKVDDWSKLCVSIYDRVNEERHYFYNFERPEKKRGHEMLDEILSDGNNPVRDVNNPVLDDVDGDFSININGIQFNWIENGAVIDIADYIEERIEE